MVTHERGVLWQEECGFKASLGYKARSCIKSESQHEPNVWNLMISAQVIYKSGLSGDTSEWCHSKRSKMLVQPDCEVSSGDSVSLEAAELGDPPISVWWHSCCLPLQEKMLSSGRGSP